MNQNGPIVFVLAVLILVLLAGLLLGVSLNNTSFLNAPARQEDCACTATSRANTQVALDVTATIEMEHMKNTLVPARLTAIPNERRLTAMAATPTPPAPLPVGSSSAPPTNSLADIFNTVMILGLCVGSPLILAASVYLIYDFQRVKN